MNPGVPVWLVKNWQTIEHLPWDDEGEAWAYQEVNVDWSVFLQLSDRDIIRKTDADKVERNRAMWTISQEVQEYVTDEKADKFGFN